MKRGFTMLEMLGVLALFAFVGTMGGQLFHQSILAINAERDSLNVDSARTSLIRRVRADALRATAVENIDNGVRLTTPDGPADYQAINRVAQSISCERAAIRIHFGEGDDVLVFAPFAREAAR